MSLMIFNPGDLASRRDDIMTRIHERVHVIDMGFKIDGMPSPCHIWTGPDSGAGRGGGYGRFSLNGVTVAVHRVVYTHYFGYIPAKKQIDHECNNRSCCNPTHLKLVTHLANQKLRAKRAKDTNNDCPSA